jgi:two-component system, OmpR family, response regulator BaeR
MTRIVIVEDELGVASVVQDYLHHAGYETTHFTDGQCALEQIVASPPDLTLLDITLPRLSGIEVLRRAREHTNHPIIMLTARIDAVDRLLGLELGADDYMAKPFSPRELVARVACVLRRIGPYDARNDEAKDVRGLVLDDLNRRVWLEGKPLNLTRREFRLVQVLSRNPGRIFSRARLIEITYEVPADVTPSAIDSQIKHLRAKLAAVTPGHDWIRTIYGIGFAWEGPVNAQR